MAALPNGIATTAEGVVGGTKVTESDRKVQRGLGEETGSGGGVRGFM